MAASTYIPWVREQIARSRAARQAERLAAEAAEAERDWAIVTEARRRARVAEVAAQVAEAAAEVTGLGGPVEPTRAMAARAAELEFARAEVVACEEWAALRARFRKEAALLCST